jgi:hypothetical protein
MSFLPALIDDGDSLSPRQLAQARRAQASTELTLFRYNLEARTRAEVDRIDSQALGDAARAALEEEFETLDWGLERANGSATKLELVHRKLEMQSAINNRRTARRFGG